MANGVLITNGNNNHSPQSWAIATASAIFDVNADVPSERRIPALRFQADLAEALATDHAGVQEMEQSALDADDAKLLAVHDVDHHVDAAMQRIQSMASQTPFADAFSDPAKVAGIRQLLGSHFATNQHIQRQAHARANPSDAASAFMSTLTAAGA